MIVAVTGGRDFDNVRLVHRVLAYFARDLPITRIIHGAAKGLDSIVDSWAKRNRIPVRAFPAKWKELGKAAGMIRNAQMLLEGHPDLLIAFPGGIGTLHCTGYARDLKFRKLKIVLIHGGPFSGE